MDYFYFQYWFLNVGMPDVSYPYDDGIYDDFYEELYE